MSLNLSLFAILCSFLSLFKKDSHINNYYNLEFRFNGKLQGWVLDPSTSAALSVDSTLLIGDKYPTVLSQPVLLGKRVFLESSMQQRVLIPETTADSAYVEIVAKGDNLKYARLVVSGIDQQESIFFSDTLSLVSNGKWNTQSSKLPAEGLRFLHLKIELEGDGQDSRQALWLDRLNLKIGDRGIEDFELPAIENIPTLAKDEIVALSPDDLAPFSDIDEFKSARILALGETVHGSETVNQAAFQLIKDQVENHHTRLVVIELPFEMMLSMNRFVNGDERFSIDSVLSSPMLYSKNELKSFALWLREHNQTLGQDERVALLGMDLNSTTYASAMDLFDYVYALNSTIQSPLLDSVCRALFSRDPYNDALQLLREQNTLASILGDREYALFKHSLETNRKAGQSTRLRFQERDAYMFENVAFLNDHFSKGGKTVIYGSFGHLNNKSVASANPTSSMGSYLKNRYGAEYRHVGLVVHQGAVFTGNTDFSEGAKFGERTITSAPNYSIEALLNRTALDYMYIASAQLPGRALAIREIGNGDRTREFDFIIPSVRMDGAIFIRESTPINADKEMLDRATYAMQKMLRNRELLSQ